MAFTPLYDAGAGAVQFAGTVETATVPPPPGTFGTEYVPLAADWTDAGAVPVVGVTVTVALVIAPPKELEMVPLTVPACGPLGPLVLQAAIKYTTASAAAKRSVRNPVSRS